MNLIIIIRLNEYTHNCWLVHDDLYSSAHEDTILTILVIGIKKL